MKREFSDISLMPVVGWVLIIAGLALFAWGIVFDPSVETVSSFGLDRIVNIGQAVKKQMIFSAGGVALIVGVVVNAAYGIRSDIRRSALFSSDDTL